MTKKERKDKINKLIFGIRQIEEMPIYRDWEKFKKLSAPDQKKIWDEWEQYYKDVKHTVAYAIFEEQMKASRNGDMSRVKELAAQVRQMRADGVGPELKKPKDRDPFDYDNSPVMRNYRILKAKLRDIDENPMGQPTSNPSDVFQE